MVADQRYRALLIGNATFPRDPHALPALHGLLVDIKELQQALTDDEVGLFAPGNLQVLPDHGVQDLRERLEHFFRHATREDVLLLYYSGHGMRDERGALYLCANDTKTASLRSAALSATEINNFIDGSAAATTIIVLDCCYSGAFKGADLATPVTGKGRYVLTSKGIHAGLDSDAWGTQFELLLAGWFAGALVSFQFVPSDVRVGRGRASFGLSMFLLGVFAAVASAFVTWAPDFPWDSPATQFGWSLRPPEVESRSQLRLVRLC